MLGGRLVLLPQSIQHWGLSQILYGTADILIVSHFRFITGREIKYLIMGCSNSKATETATTSDKKVSPSYCLKLYFLYTVISYGKQRMGKYEMRQSRMMRLVTDIIKITRRNHVCDFRGIQSKEVTTALIKVFPSGHDLNSVSY